MDIRVCIDVTLSAKFLEDESILPNVDSGHEFNLRLH